MPGTGLGLYIVKRLGRAVGRHHAARESDGPGRGATVTIRWPEEEHAQ